MKSLLIPIIVTLALLPVQNTTIRESTENISSSFSSSLSKVSEKKKKNPVNGWSPDGQQYYKGGKYVTGPLIIDGFSYYFDEETGNMVHGWKYLEDQDITVWYGQLSGHMMFGEQYIEDHYYYLDDETGAVSYGWKELDAPDRKAYYDAEGHKVFGLQLIDGEWHEFSSVNGSHIGKAQGWEYIPDSGEFVFRKADGDVMKGTTNINGISYAFDEETGNLHFKGTTTNLYNGETNAIIDAHRYDFNYSNMQTVFKNYGGYENYVKSLGGVFTKYANIDNCNVKTVAEFQEVADYVWGMMTIYGFDYYKAVYGSNSCWGGKYPANDAFYTNSSSLKSVYGKSNSNTAKIDDVLAGNTSAGMQVNCTQGITYILRKSGLISEDAPTIESEFYGYKSGDSSHHYYRNRGAKIFKTKSLQVGDVLGYFKGSSYWHVAMVVRVNRSSGTYTIYDSGHCLSNKRTGMRTLKIGASPGSLFKSSSDWYVLRLPLNLQ